MLNTVFLSIPGFCGSLPGFVFQYTIFCGSKPAWSHDQQDMATWLGCGMRVVTLSVYRPIAKEHRFEVVGDDSGRAGRQTNEFKGQYVSSGTYGLDHMYWMYIWSGHTRIYSYHKLCVVTIGLPNNSAICIVRWFSNSTIECVRFALLEECVGLVIVQ